VVADLTNQTPGPLPILWHQSEFAITPSFLPGGFAFDSEVAK